MLKKRKVLKVVFVHKEYLITFWIESNYLNNSMHFSTYLVVKKIVQSHNVSLAEYSSTFYIDFFKIDSTL